MVQFIRSDLEFILQQILIAEGGVANPLLDGFADPSNLINVLPNVQVPWGLRTVDGSYNNLVFIDNSTVSVDQTQFGAADTIFPRSLTPTFRLAEPVAFDPDGPAGQAVGDPTSYTQTSGSVFDSQPRTISNLIVDQTANNPAAVAAAAANPGAQVVMSPGLDGVFGTADDRPVEFMPNISPDVGLAAPFNAWFTFFGQFFDHGLDLVTKGGQDLVFVPLKADDPLVAGADGIFGNADDLPPQLRFMVETRATNVSVDPGPDTVLGTADDIHNNQNTTTPFVDQNQTYTSHPSHQVFLRAYQLLAVDPDGAGPIAERVSPFNTGKLITNKDLGADGRFGGDGANADHEIGGMATWGVVKAQARDLLGITLTDAQVGNVPLLATDAYGNFIAGPHGLPQVVVSVSIVDSNGPTPVITPVSGNFLAEGKIGGLDINHLTVADLEAGHPPLPALLAGQVFQVSVVGTGHQFLIDIAHAANPFDDFGHPLIADADNVVNTFAGIPLSNNSFEADSMATGAPNVQQDDVRGNFAQIQPQDWTITGLGGVYAPTAAVIAAAGHAGSNVVFLDEGATLARDTGVLLQEGRVYQLTFNLGNRTDQTDFDGGTARLVTNEGTVLATLTLPMPQDGHWSPVTLKTGPILAANAGEHLRIEISDGGTTNSQILIDNVLLTSGVPAAAGTYDNELLDAHYIAGDGRANENIGLTAVHSIFHSEHNRLVDQTKQLLITDALKTGNVDFLNNWLLSPLPSLAGVNPDNPDALIWNGERLFQVGRFGTEMQYQHLVFEEFARTVQPGVDEFLAPNGYDTTINPAIVAEFAHTVYRFGHSMLTETVDRFDANLNVVSDPTTADPNDQLGLIAAFLNPLAFVASGITPEDATSAIVRGTTRTVGNAIDEFITEALRNNLLGTPLDLAVLNIARGRDTGIPSLNEARREFYVMTSNNNVGDSNMKPYISWVDLMGHLRHPESLINFIAAYGTHPLITAETTLEGKRAAAFAIVTGASATVFGDPTTPNDDRVISAPDDALDFLNSTGTWANTPLPLAGHDKILGTPDDILSFMTHTGVDDIDFWVGGLAEDITPFGGMLGSTFNFVFENQLENLQNGDRFYYLSRTAGLNFGTELENSLFSQLVMLNTNAKHLPADIFSTPTWILEVDATQQFTGLGADGRADPTQVDDPTGGITINGQVFTPVVVRGDHYLQYIGENHVVLGGTDAADTLISGIGDDTLYGDGGKDRLEGGAGDDQLFGGDGDDIITDMGGITVMHGDAGNDVLIDSHSLAGAELSNILLGGEGKDFIATWDDISTIFGGRGDDFIYGSKPNLPETGNEGDDWIELGTQDGAPGDNFSPFLGDEVDGNDIFVGGGGFDEMIGEGGDDIFVGSDAQDKMDGMSGFDWVTYKNDKIGVTVDIALAALNEPPVAASPASIIDRFAEVEGVSGSKYADYIRGDNSDADVLATFSAKTSALQAHGIALIDGMQEFLDSIFAFELIDPVATPLPVGDLFTTDSLGVNHISQFGTGNMLFGGAGSDVILPLGGDDLIDGDRWLNVRVGVDENRDGVYDKDHEISFDSLAPLIPKMLDGTYDPGQLFAVREVLDTDDAFDTVVYRGNRADYSILVNGVEFVEGSSINAGDEVTVIDNDRRPRRDETDHLMNVERLQFADTAVDLVQGRDQAPTRGPVIDDPNGGPITVGDMLTVSFDRALADPDGAITGPIRYTWQASIGRGTSAFFDDIILLPGGDLAFESASGTHFRVTPDLAGLTIRVKALYTDANGVTEMAFSAPTAIVEGAPVTPVVPVVDHSSSNTDVGGEGIKLVRSDLDFILDQIRIAERHVAGESLTDLIPNIRLAYGLRTVDGSENNLNGLVGGVDQNQFGQADNTFPRLLDPVLRTAETKPADFFFPGDLAGTTPTSYTQTAGNVFDSQPRTISNLIVDQTLENPAAVAAALKAAGSTTVAADTAALAAAHQLVVDAQHAHDADAIAAARIALHNLGDSLGVDIVVSPGLDGRFGTMDDQDVFKLDNVTPDVGLGAPFNAWFTFFGQFFDHGLDLVTKGGNGKIYIPLQPDDPLYVPGSPTNFMVETRATVTAVHLGADGVLGTADDIHDNENTTTPFVDQNQTYTSHPSHQAFLRAYQMVDGHPIATGKLITNKDLGADGHFGGEGANADTEIGGMATWAVVKAQARDLLGINLTDKDFDNVPLLATDQYGNFTKGEHGFPMVVMSDGVGGTFLAEGDPLNPLDLTNAVRTGHQFLIDVNDEAVPVFDALGNLAPDANNVAGGAPQPRDALGHKQTYDNELLDAHYIAGDGRVNENIGLTTVHSIFHSEHNRLVDQAKQTVLDALAAGDKAFAAEWVLGATPEARLAAVQDGIQETEWNGERLFQVAKFGTEMQYQHLVFEEFARTIQPMIDPFFAPTQVYDVDLDPSIVAEFAHTVYRFGHSMLTETVDRFDADFNIVSDPNTADPNDQLGLIAAFLNPLAFAASGPTPEDATSAIVRGITRTVGNEIDEFVTDALRNNLLGTPLDLAVLNLARGRDTGIPSLNAARRDFYTQTGDSWVKPYTSWADLVQHLKHPESLINFIAAYGTHHLITDATTLADKRAAATLLVLGGDGEPADRLDFLNSTGSWASTPVIMRGPDHIGGTADDVASFVTTTGVDNIDFWVGGLAEAQMPFGGLLGSTFNFVFENTLEKLQDGDRFYYLERTSGLSFGNELESNSFAKLIMANTNAVHLPALVFTTPAFTLEVDKSKQFTGLGVANGSFEADSMAIGAPGVTPDPVNGNFALGLNPQGGWTINGFGGVYAPTATVISATGHQGGNVVFLDGGATLANTTDVVLLAGSVYQLTFNVGDRLDQGAGGGTARLLAVDSVGVTTVLKSIDLPAAPNGAWTVATLATDPVAATLAGQHLRIEITDGNGSGTQTLIDNVELTRSGGLLNADPTGGITINGHEITPLVIRDNPDTIGPDTHFLHYTGEDHVVLGGTDANDIILSGIGDDTLWGDGGDDRLDGGYGDDNVRGGAGDDIITDTGGVDNIQGGDGNDVIQGGAGGDLILGGFGKDFIITGEDNSEAFGGAGDDFILGNKSNEQDIGNEGDDWIEKGTSDGAPGDNFDPLGNDPIPGNDIFIGDGENDKFIGEGGDDIMVASPGLTDRMFGASGFDWITYKNDPIGVTIDLDGRFFDQPPVPGSGASALARFDLDEALAGSQHDDFLFGDNMTDLIGGEVGKAVNGGALTNVKLIDGLAQFLDTAFAAELANPLLLPVGVSAAAGHITGFATGNILIGGHGSDFLMGRGGDDIIDGDAWLNVRISVRQNVDGTGPEVATFDTMQEMVPYMLNGIYKVGQLIAVREILDSNPVTTTAADFDTAKFTGPLTDLGADGVLGGGDDVQRYTFMVDGTPVTLADLPTAAAGPGHVITVTDTIGDDGTDRLMNIERLGFSDGYVDLAPTLNADPFGQMAILNFDGSATTTPVEIGQKLKVNIGADGSLLNADGSIITDADNPGTHSITGPIAYFWQVDEAGDGNWLDVIAFAAGEFARADGPVFIPDAAVSGSFVRVRAVYEDGHGVLEEVFSNRVEIAVDPLGEPPEVAEPPTDVTLASLIVPENEAGATIGTLTVTDPNIGDTHTLTVDDARFEVVTVGGVHTLKLKDGMSLDFEAAQSLVLNVTATDQTGLSATFPVTFNVTNANDAATGALTVDITAPTKGGMLTASTSGIDDQDGLSNPSFAFQWQQSDLGGGGTFTDIAGAHDQNFAPGAGQVNRELRVVVSFTDDQGSTESVTSAATDVVTDVFVGTAGNDTFNGTAGGDQASGNGGKDTLNGLAGNDSLDGGTGNDTLSGGDGNDMLVGGSGNDSLSGGTGDDAFKYTVGDGVDTFKGDGGMDTLSILGTAGNNVLSVSLSGTALTGFSGGSLDGIESVTLDLGLGKDILSYSGASAAVEVNLANHTATGFASIKGVENVIGGSGNDTLTGDDAANVLSGGAGNDTYYVGAGDQVTESAGGGTDTVNSSVSFTLGGNIENLTLTAHAAIKGSGNSLDNMITDTGGGDNLLTGGGGNDTIDGGAGNDNIDGGTGNDRLIGGTGDDRMNAGSGNDTFVFAAGFGHDRIDSFDTNPSGGQDLLDISGLNITAANFNAHVVITHLGSDMLVTIDHADSILLKGLSGTGANSLTSADFLLHL